LFSNGTNFIGGIHEEGVQLINFYQSLTTFTAVTLKSEINNIIPNIFTEKEPSAI